MRTVTLIFQQQAVPRTQAELDALEARRDALSDQFQAVTHRRGMLAQERLNAEARVARNAGGRNQSNAAGAGRDRRRGRTDLRESALRDEDVGGSVAG